MGRGSRAGGGRRGRGRLVVVVVVVVVIGLFGFKAICCRRS